ncbi:YkvA family protein [Alteromonas facilis]|uniref:YkvA family protein n=1 Tax=Alteromonas facilis TaxID=2048004 RepID=UPI000C28DEB6|nr:YkvA family protein [Alteromonas facilis]
MSLDINIELNESDLEHFKNLMTAAIDKAKSLPAETIIKRAQEMCVEMEQARVPDFVAKRLVSLEMLIQAVQDEDWQMPEDERIEVLTSLAYFAEPHDLVPDSIPGLGYLDDAIMIELVIRDLSEDLEAYQAFCAYRITETNRRGGDSTVDRETWLEGKRSELRSRLRRNKSTSGRRRVFSRIM